MFLLDRIARTLADVLLPEGAHVKHALVKQGWWYRTYAPGDTVLEGLEKAAQEGQIGLWADPQPVPPWEWRKRKESGAAQRGQDASTGEGLRRVVGHIRATRYSKIEWDRTR